MTERKAYLVGGGIASLASAAYLIKEGRLLGSNIHIFDSLKVAGGSLDGSGDPQRGYVMRGGRMLNFSYNCTYDLLSFIPSLADPSISVLNEIKEFNERVKTHANARLVYNGRRIDTEALGLSTRDLKDMTEMLLRPEGTLKNSAISDHFSEKFFTTNFWYMWATMFAFQPWHSAVEFKRYMHRFLHELHRINTLAGVDRTPYNQYDSIVRPVQKWLEGQGVRFHLDTVVTDLGTTSVSGQKRVSSLRLGKSGQDSTIDVQEQDLVFVTNGSMTANSTLGSMNSPASLSTVPEDPSWALWKRLADGHPEIGRPEIFSDRVGESKWLSFTVTLNDPLFFDLMEKFTGNSAGTGALVTLTDSNWLMSVVLAYQPHFINQPKDIQVFWGYGLYVDRPGNFVQKRMSDCTGAEIMTELCSHLRFNQDLPKILMSANCIPCMMPYITSQFLTRSKGDRPAVVPAGWTNLAFVSQFCEIPDDVVFTVEYSVRAAQTAVFKLLDLDKEVTPMYRGDRDFRVLIDALKSVAGSSSRTPDLPEHPLHP